MIGSLLSILGPVILVVVLAWFLVKTNLKVTYWRSVARGDITDDEAHIECQRTILELQHDVTRCQNSLDRERKERQKLEKIFAEKVEPVMNEATKQLAEWIREEEAELAAKEADLAAKENS